VINWEDLEGSFRDVSPVTTRRVVCEVLLIQLLRTESEVFPETSQYDVVTHPPDVVTHPPDVVTHLPDVVTHLPTYPTTATNIPLQNVQLIVDDLLRRPALSADSEIVVY